MRTADHPEHQSGLDLCHQRSKLVQQQIQLPYQVQFSPRSTSMQSAALMWEKDLLSPTKAVPQPTYLKDAPGLPSHFPKL
jgi:hypothetical protein